MKITIYGAGSDLGVHIDGAALGPVQLIKDLKSFYDGEIISVNQNPNIIKSRNLSDRRKNEYEIERLNTELYKNILEKNKEEYFPITIGGDKSIAVASSLATAKKFGNENIGLIWLSAHPDYNTFNTTISGNIAGLSLSAINGYENHELRYFHDGSIIQTARSVVIGARNIENSEQDNIRYSGINVFTTEDIKTKGIEEVLKEAFEIVSRKTSGIHICFSLDLIDPDIAPGVSIPEFEGISEEDAMKINEEILKHIEDITSYDLLDFNPLRDENRKTEQIALNLLAQVINAAKKKGKNFDKIY